MVTILTAQLVVSCCIHGAKWPALSPDLAPPPSLQGLVLHYHPITHDTSQNTQGGNTTTWLATKSWLLVRVSTYLHVFLLHVLESIHNRGGGSSVVSPGAAPATEGEGWKWVGHFVSFLAWVDNIMRKRKSGELPLPVTPPKKGRSAGKYSC